MKIAHSRMPVHSIYSSVKKSHNQHTVKARLAASVPLGKFNINFSFEKGT